MDIEWRRAQPGIYMSSQADNGIPRYKITNTLFGKRWQVWIHQIGEFYIPWEPKTKAKGFEKSTMTFDTLKNAKAAVK
jgi:hypothetical protein